MSEDVFDKYLAEMNTAYLRGYATEHAHKPASARLAEERSGRFKCL